MNRWFLILFVGIMLSGLVMASSFGYDNPTLPRLVNKVTGTIGSTYNYNMTSNGTYNATYAEYAYNQTKSLYWYNMTIHEFLYNMTQSPYFYNMTDTEFYYNMSIGDGSYNASYVPYNGASQAITLDHQSIIINKSNGGDPDIETTFNPSDFLQIWKTYNPRYLNAINYLYSDGRKVMFGGTDGGGIPNYFTIDHYNQNVDLGLVLRLQSRIADGGLSPFIITSKTVNTNLNADLLDGVHASDLNGTYNSTYHDHVNNDTIHNSTYLYNQTQTEFYYNMSDGTSGYNSTYDAHVNNDTKHNTTYWYNQTNLTYLYNQTTSLYFYNQTASPYFYNMTVGASDTNCNSTGSCREGDVAYMDYVNNKSFYANSLSIGYYYVSGSAASGSCPNFDGLYLFQGDFVYGAPAYEKLGGGAYLDMYSSNQWVIDSVLGTCGDCYISGRYANEIEGTYDGAGGDCVGDSITVTSYYTNASIAGRLQSDSLQVYDLLNCEDDGEKIGVNATGELYCDENTFGYNQTANLYFYNQTASLYFYNQTKSPFFYNMTSASGSWVGTATSNLNMSLYNITNVSNIIGSGILNMSSTIYGGGAIISASSLYTYSGQVSLGQLGVSISPQIPFLNNQGGSGWIIHVDNDASYMRIYENGTAKFFIYGLGLGDYLKHPGTYTETVGATNRDLFVDNTGKFGYVSSSITSKENVTNMTKADWIYKLQPVYYDMKNATKDSERNLTGLIAEDVEKVNPDLVSYKRGENTTCYNDSIGEEECETTYFDTDEPETVSYSKLVVPLLTEVQNLKKENTALKNCIIKSKTLIEMQDCIKTL